jgi:hypothetical protein
VLCRADKSIQQHSLRSRASRFTRSGWVNSTNAGGVPGPAGPYFSSPLWRVGGGGDTPRGDTRIRSQQTRTFVYAAVDNPEQANCTRARDGGQNYLLVKHGGAVEFVGKCQGVVARLLRQRRCGWTRLDSLARARWWKNRDYARSFDGGATFTRNIRCIVPARHPARPPRSSSTHNGFNDSTIASHLSEPTGGFFRWDDC